MAPPKGSTRNPSWFKSGGNGGGDSASLADNLSYSMIPKPFKDEKLKKGARRSKPLKQILALEKLRAKQASETLKMNATPPDEDVDMNNDAPPPPPQEQQQQVSTSSKKAKKEILGPVHPDVNYNTYMMIEAPPSVIPPKKYCDITGLEAPYVDPKTRLRYHNTEGPGLDQSYLSLRGAHVTLR